MNLTIPSALIRAVITPQAILTARTAVMTSLQAIALKPDEIRRTGSHRTAKTIQVATAKHLIMLTARCPSRNMPHMMVAARISITASLVRMTVEADDMRENASP